MNVACITMAEEPSLRFIRKIHKLHGQMQVRLLDDEVKIVKQRQGQFTYLIFFILLVLKCTIKKFKYFTKTK